MLADKAGHTDRASADWLRAVRQQPELAQTAFQRAFSLMRSGQAALQGGRMVEAIRDLQKARDWLRNLHQLVPGNGQVASQLSLSLAFLASALKNEHRLAEALEATQESSRVLEAIRQPTFVDLYNLACAYANLTTLVESGKTPVTSAEREALADRPMQAFRRSLAAGMKDFALIDSDADLDPLRNRPDFRAMVLDRVFPRDPFAEPSPLDR
jgi:tetratricopeptide (TPR) repeat protein